MQKMKIIHRAFISGRRHNYVEKGTDHLSRLADFLEGIQNGEITDCEWIFDFLWYSMDDEISICLPSVI